MCLCPDSSASLSIFTGGLPAHGFVLALRNVFEVMNNIAVFHDDNRAQEISRRGFLTFEHGLHAWGRGGSLIIP